MGSVIHPYNTPDMSAYVLQAMAGKAQVIELANSSIDAINSIKQARDFGAAAQGQQIAAVIMLINDVHDLGLEAGQGLYLTEPFYWDLNAQTRAFSDRFAARPCGRRPSMVQAGVSRCRDGVSEFSEARKKDPETSNVLTGNGFHSTWAQGFHEARLTLSST